MLDALSDWLGHACSDWLPRSCECSDWPARYSIWSDGLPGCPGWITELSWSHPPALPQAAVNPVQLNLILILGRSQFHSWWRTPRRMVMCFWVWYKQKQPWASAKTHRRGKMAWKIIGLDTKIGLENWIPKILWVDSALLRWDMGRGSCCLWYFKNTVQLNIQQIGFWAWIRVKIVKAVTLIVEETTYQDSSRNWMGL